MIHGTVQYSSVRPFARHDDGSFGTLREMEKTVERHFGLGAKNEKRRSGYCSVRSRERGRHVRVHCIRAFVYVFACMQAYMLIFVPVHDCMCMFPCVWVCVSVRACA